MAQNTNVSQEPFRYTRSDFAALRAWVQKLPIERIAQTYYADDAPQVMRGLARHLEEMRKDLIDRAVLANPKFSDMLAKARMGGSISLGVLDVLIKAGDATPLPPSPKDLIAQWFRRKVATQLIGQGIHTLAELKTLIERRGYTWWQAVPRIGRLRAQAVVAWMNKTQSLAISSASQVPSLPEGTQVVLSLEPVPLERISALPSHLNGSQGINRATTFSYLQAKDDLQAIQAYLSGFRDQPHTFRAYERELERLLLWSVLVRKKPLSSLLVPDCEAYKDFLSDPKKEIEGPPRISFAGPRRSRTSPHWRPFASSEKHGVLLPHDLALSTQRQAIQIIRTAFNFLTATRYLGGNPWLAVKDPRMPKALNPMQIERALRADLWHRVIIELDRICADPAQRQARIGRAAIMLMGTCGLRSSEAARVRQRDLQTSQFARVSELTVLGKRDKLRTVPMSSRAVEAIKAHWLDHGQSLLVQVHDGSAALVRPLIVPATDAALVRHEKTGAGYAPVALTRMAKSVLAMVAQSPDFDDAERALITKARAHDLRHTFATLSVEDGLPLDVTQSMLGHQSLATTSIYVQAQQRRIAQEGEKLFETQENRMAASKAAAEASILVTVSVDKLVENDTERPSEP